MSLREDIISSLIKGGISSPRLEADIILKHAAPMYPEISKAETEKALLMLNRRLNHEPMDKIIGQREFYKYVFKVNQDVLSPRPDTEILVESALQILEDKKAAYNLLDLGTGSGCILLSLLKELPKAKGIGVDISVRALNVAAENANLLGLLPQTEFINKSWTELSLPKDSFDMIVTNPPYIATKEINTLEPEVKNFDPMFALDGGKDGLKAYRQIANIAPQLLKKGGYILIEAGQGQERDIAVLFTAQGLTFVKNVPDLAGINRCVILKK